MKIYRYMSKKEFQLYTAGVPMIHAKNNLKANTTSVGFCFLGEKTQIKNNICYSSVECLEFLEGIVTNDVLVEMTAPDELLKKSLGIYASPFNYDDTICIQEYCAKSYDLTTFIPCRYAMVAASKKADWYTI